jgi:hypothetical protein
MPARAAAILDHERLSPSPSVSLVVSARRHDVAAAAGGERHDHLHRLARIGLVEPRPGKCGKQKTGEKCFITR